MNDRRRFLETSLGGAGRLVAAPRLATALEVDRADARGLNRHPGSR